MDNEECYTKILKNEAYARNFKRPGIESGIDLLWNGKLECHCYYHHTDEEVK